MPPVDRRIRQEGVFLRDPILLPERQWGYLGVLREFVAGLGGDSGGPRVQVVLLGELAAGLLAQ